MAHYDLVALFHVASERATAQDLEIVRVRADGENSQNATVPLTVGLETLVTRASSV
jgi:hypothetical protein